tara:strand:+ start:127 stop:390 length:264 start_codon:yes stop_codon:yes gene_type:complete
MCRYSEFVRKKYLNMIADKYIAIVLIGGSIAAGYGSVYIMQHKEMDQSLLLYTGIASSVAFLAAVYFAERSHEKQRDYTVFERTKSQ